MALAHVAARGTAADTASASSIGVAPTAGIALGNLLIVRVAAHNLSASTGATNEHTSVTDTQGNTYTKLHEYTLSNGGASLGLTVSIWAAVLTTALTTGDTVTVNISGAVIHRTISLSEFTAVSPALEDFEGTNGTSTTPSVALSGMPSAEYLLLGVTGYRRTAADTETFDADYSLDVGVFDTGAGGNNARVKHWGEYRIATLTGDTYAAGNSASGAWVAILVAIAEATGPAYDAIMKVWNGSAFVAPGGIVKYWDGSVWQTGVFKAWDGTDFLVVTPDP